MQETPYNGDPGTYKRVRVNEEWKAEGSTSDGSLCATVISICDLVLDYFEGAYREDALRRLCANEMGVYS